jgi:hypothetical protein
VLQQDAGVQRVPKEIYASCTGVKVVASFVLNRTEHNPSKGIYERGCPKRQQDYPSLSINLKIAWMRQLLSHHYHLPGKSRGAGQACQASRQEGTRMV